MKLLVVEDNETILLGLEYLLRKEGYEVVSVSNYRKAEELLGQDVFDLILLDITLPDGDGYELCRKIKHEQDVPVIFLTAKDEENDVVQGFELGADDYIQKPFRNRELISRIQNVLRRTGTGLAYSHGE